jgi:hypothetical protein
MGLLGEWRAARERERRARVYLGALLAPPPADDLAWLAAQGGVADVAVAQRELAFARRAVGLIVAERDALDDRTAADVAHALGRVVAAEARRTPASGRAWAERWRAYVRAMAVRGGGESPAARMARVLLAGAGIAAPSRQQLGRVAQVVTTMRVEANAALTAAYGAASLPEDVPPSALVQGRGRR